MSKASIRRQLDAIRTRLERDQHEQQAPVTFDDLCARYLDGAGNLKLPADDRTALLAAVRVDWDSLGASARPYRDPAPFLLVSAREVLSRYEATLPAPQPHSGPAPSGFLSVPAPDSDAN